MNVINNPEVNIQRYEAWLMLMRSDADYTPVDETATECTVEEVLACATDGGDMEACLAACSGDETDEEEDNTPDVVKAGDLYVDGAKTSMAAEIPVNIVRVPLLTFEVEAGDEDITLFSADLSFLGYGDYTNLDNVSIYNSKNLRVSREKAFTSNDLTLGFNANIVIKKGAKETFTIVGMVSASDNSTYGVSLIDLSTSASNVDGLPVKGISRKTIEISNVGELEFNDDSYNTNSITVGEEEVLASFNLDNADDYEDVMIETIVLTAKADDDMFTNLALYANDELVADNLDFQDDTLVANISYVIETETDVDFELRGEVTKIDTDFYFSIDQIEDIYAYGTKYGFNTTIIDLTDETTVGDLFTTEGSEITVSFDRTNVDEIKPDTKDVYVGTLTFKSEKTNYLINELEMLVSDSEAIVDDVRLNNISYDNTSIDGYTFEDIDLPAGKTVSLKVYVDVADTATEGDEIEVDFNLNDIVIEDLDNDVQDVEDVLSTSDVTAKNLTIQDASLDVAQEVLNDRSVVLGGQSYELAYRARVDAGDAAAIKVKTVKFAATETVSGYDLKNIVDNATLTLNGVEYGKTRINADGIDFSNINAVVPAGTTNAKMLLNIKLKSSDTMTGTVYFTVDSIDAEDNADGDDVIANVDNTINTTLLTLTNAGELTVSFDMDDSSSTTMNMFTEQSKYALAGSDAKVVLAKVKLKADREAIKVENMVLTGYTDGDFNGSIDTVSFVLADDMNTELGSTDHYGAGNGFTIELNDVNFTVEANKTIYGYVLATFKAIDEDVNATEAGAEDGAYLEDLNITNVEFKGVSSNKDETELNLTNNANGAYDVTVAANTIASVQLEAVKSSIVAGKNLIAKLKVTPTSQNWNVDSEGDAFNAFLASVDLGTTPSYTSGAVSYYIKKVGQTTTGAINGSALTGAAREIDGTTTFEIYAEVTAVTDSEANIQVTLDDATDDVWFYTQFGGEDLNYLLPEGVSATTIVNTK